MNWWQQLAAGAAIGALAAWWLTHTADAAVYARLEKTYATYQAQVAQQRADGESAARAALQKQIDAQRTKDEANAQILETLRQRSDAADAQHVIDVAYIRSLLEQANASAAGAPGGGVPQGGGEPGAAAPGEARRTTAMAAAILCADTKREDEFNADQLDALIGQLKGQTTVH